MSKMRSIDVPEYREAGCLCVLVISQGQPQNQPLRQDLFAGKLKEANSDQRLVAV